MTDIDVRRLLAEARTIAVIGAHPDTVKPAHYVPEYLRAQGYRVLPVNPAHVGKVLFGETVRATLAELKEPVDIVDVFRRGPDVMGHIEDILAMEPRPRTVWLQLGIRNEEAARVLAQNGIEVVQDRCTLADHKAFGIGRVA